MELVCLVDSTSVLPSLKIQLLFRETLHRSGLIHAVRHGPVGSASLFNYLGR